MMQSSWTQSAVIDEPDMPIQPETTGNGAGGDFTFAVYKQLSQIQRDVGALTATQARLDAHIKESEVRFSDLTRASELRLTRLGAESEKRLAQLSRESEERLAKRVEKLETGALERVKTTEDKLSSLKDFVHRLFWTGTGIVAVLGVTLGWKPIWLWVSTVSL
jgi:ElaB/YqjD/DUF883 family membrane-anchored ribosome-binding protein